MLKREQPRLTVFAVKSIVFLWIALHSTLLSNIGYAQELPANSDRSIPSIPRIHIKSNLLYDATATFNLGAEFWLSQRTSLDVSGNWNPWTFNANRKWKHVLVQPEFRWWTKETFRGHFFGLHAHYAYYNVGNLPNGPFSRNMKESRYEGWLAGAGVGYGYRWNFARRWALEAEIGVGYAYLDYDKYECGNCGVKLSSDTRHYFGPTKAAVSLIYGIGSVKKKEPMPEPIYIPPVIEVVPEPLPPVEPVYVVSYIEPEIERVKYRKEPDNAYLDFAVGRSDIVASFRNNAAELDRINGLIAKTKNDPDITITRITIDGYASPEGTYQMNLTLSEKRAAALKKHMRTVYGFPEGLFVVNGKGEDWAMLDTLVEQSSIGDKYRILEIIRGTDIFDGREKKLMNLSGGAPYREMLAGMFPKLRRSEYTLYYTVAPLSVERAKEVFKVRPSSLSANEMFLLANTYPQDSDAFNEVVETAARFFPEDDMVNINAAANALAHKDLVKAERYLKRVSEQGQNEAYRNNLEIFEAMRK